MRMSTPAFVARYIVHIEGTLYLKGYMFTTLDKTQVSPAVTYLWKIYNMITLLSDDSCFISFPADDSQSNPK